jgi:hypothetical protein
MIITGIKENKWKGISTNYGHLKYNFSCLPSFPGNRWKYLGQCNNMKLFNILFIEG